MYGAGKCVRADVSNVTCSSFQGLFALLPFALSTACPTPLFNALSYKTATFNPVPRLGSLFAGHAVRPPKWRSSWVDVVVIDERLSYGMYCCLHGLRPSTVCYGRRPNVGDPSWTTVTKLYKASQLGEYGCPN